MEILEKIGEFCKHVAIPIFIALILGWFLLASVPVKAEVHAEYPPLATEDTTMVVILGDDGEYQAASVKEDGTFSHFELAGEHIVRYKAAIDSLVRDLIIKYEIWKAEQMNQQTKLEAVEADPKT